MIRRTIAIVLVSLATGSAAASSGQPVPVPSTLCYCYVSGCRCVPVAPDLDCHRAEAGLVCYVFSPREHVRQPEQKPTTSRRALVERLRAGIFGR